VGIEERLRLDGRTVLVAGAGGAIGSAAARTLADAGARLVLVDIDAGRLDAMAQLLAGDGREHLVEQGDTCNVAGLTALVDRAAADCGAIHGLLYVVGGVEPPEFGPFLGYGTRTYDDIMDRNLRGAVVTHEVVAAHMAASGRGGSIVSISAATAFASSPFHALYGAAKAALIALARTQAVEWGPLGIRVNTVAPGAVETRPPADPAEVARWERAAIPLGRRVQPHEIAGAALFLLSDLASSITGQTLVLDGGALAKPAFLDADNVPVFVTDKALRDRMRGQGTGAR
jgi:NAD(P)-dependent dehydrogenase (short-subunit alcohol dehydrogenase family)